MFLNKTSMFSEIFYQKQINILNRISSPLNYATLHFFFVRDSQSLKFRPTMEESSDGQQQHLLKPACCLPTGRPSQSAGQANPPAPPKLTQHHGSHRSTWCTSIRSTAGPTNSRAQLRGHLQFLSRKNALEIHHKVPRKSVQGGE